jgi:signal peptidase I
MVRVVQLQCALEVADGKVYINDQLLIEPYITAVWHDTKAKQTIPAGDYFVMGDNRDNSLDSRFWGTVPRSSIVGRAMFVYWSIDRSNDGESSSNPAVDFFTKTRWSRTGTFIK